MCNKCFLGLPKTTPLPVKRHLVFTYSDVHFTEFAEVKINKKGLRIDSQLLVDILALYGKLIVHIYKQQNFLM